VSPPDLSVHPPRTCVNATTDVSSIVLAPIPACAAHLLLFLGQLRKLLLRDQILDADQPRVGFITIVDDALVQVLAQVRAEMVGLDRS